MRRRSLFLELMFVLISIILLFVVHSSCTVASSPNAKFQVQPSTLHFDLDTYPVADWISSRPTMENITISRKTQGEGAGSFVLRLDGPLETSQGHEISSELIQVRRRNGFAASWQPLDQDVLILGDDEDEALLEFRISRDAWGPKGNYKGWLISNHGHAMRVVVHVQPYTAIRFISQESVFIHASSAPGEYWADDNPVEVLIISNHGQWDLSMEAENMTCVDDSGGVLEKEQLFVSLGAVDSDNKLYFNEPLLIYGNNDSQRMIYLFFGYDTDWSHRAGTYRGKVDFTLSSSASPVDRWEE